MKMEHWEDTVDYLLKDTDDVDRSILKNNEEDSVQNNPPRLQKC